MALLQGAEQHDGGGDREGEAEDDAGSQRPAEQMGEADPEQRCGGDLDHGAGNCDGFDGEQVGQREMQADAEHQQNDADFGEFGGKALVGDEAGRERADGDAGEQVAYDGGNAQPLGKRAQDEGQRQADDNGGDQWRIVRHRGGWPPCVDAKMDGRVG